MSVKENNIGKKQKQKRVSEQGAMQTILDIQLW